MLSVGPINNIEHRLLFFPLSEFEIYLIIKYLFSIKSRETGRDWEKEVKK